jgi:signal transduction histidine kinase
MDEQTLALTRSDWTLFGLRWVIVAVLAAAASLAAAGANSSVMTSDIVLAVIVGSIVNGLFLVFAAVKPLRVAVPAAVIVGDVIIAALLVRLNPTDPLYLAGCASVLIVNSVLYLGFLWGLAGAAAVIVAVETTLFSTTGQDLRLLLADQTEALLIMALVSAVGVLWSWALQQRIADQEADLRDIQAHVADDLNRMRDSTRAVIEMAATLSRTLDFEKVLNAALDTGRMALHERDSRRRVISVALLFRDDGNLHVTASRRLPHSDASRSVPGRSGILGQALTECVPVIGKDARKDDELQYFVGFQTMRSVLCIPLRAGFDNFGVLLYGSEENDAFTTGQMDLLTSIGTQATIALQNAVLYRNLAQEQKRLIAAEEEARKKLARDLHDGPTQQVSAIAMRMSYIGRLLERSPDEVPEELKKVEELARETTKVIRNMLFTLRPLVLESQGLTAAVEQLAQKVHETYGQAVAVRIEHDAETALNSQQQSVIFSIIDEAVNNARKHAVAELISVNMVRQQDVVLVTIADNGVGFDMGAVEANYDQRGSLGMVNMRERTDLINASLRIASAEGRGTTITIAVPLKDSQELMSGRSTKAARAVGDDTVATRK